MHGTIGIPTLPRGVWLSPAAPPITPCTAGTCFGIVFGDNGKVYVVSTLNPRSCVSIEVEPQHLVQLLDDVRDGMAGLLKLRPVGVTFAQHGDSFIMLYRTQSIIFNAEEVTDLLDDPRGAIAAARCRVNALMEPLAA